MSAAIPTNTFTAADLAARYAPSIAGKTILTTGVSPSSLGAAFVTGLASASSPSTIILAGRSASKLSQTADAVRAVNASVAIKTVVVDLLSLKDVRRAAQEVLDWEDVPVIDVVVNNAGIMAVEYGVSADGFEKHFASNHLAHFLLTNLLMPKLLKSKEPRVVNIASDGHRVSPIRWDDHQFHDGETYNKWLAYGQSKTANILFSLGLSRKLQNHNLISFGVHPGLVVATSLSGHLDFEKDMAGIAELDRFLGNIAGWSTAEDMQKVMVSPEIGAATHVFASFDPEIKKNNGQYLLDARVADPFKDTVKPWVTSAVEADRLWTLSEKLVGQEFSY